MDETQLIAIFGFGFVIGFGIGVWVACELWQGLQPRHWKKTASGGEK